MVKDTVILIYKDSFFIPSKNTVEFFGLSPGLTLLSEEEFRTIKMYDRSDTLASLCIRKLQQNLKET